MKKNIIKTVLSAAVLMSVFLFYLSCGKTNAASMTPTTTIVLQAPNAGFSYEVLFEPIVEFHGEAFPVKILSTATRNTSLDGSSRMIATADFFGDSLGDFGVTLSLNGSSGDTVPVRVEIEGDRFIRKSGIDVIMPLNRKIEIFPRISYDYNALERLVQPASENVYFRLLYGSVAVSEKMEVVRFHSVNEVPFYIADKNGESVEDYTWLFAAYVNEDDPLIDTILKEALQIGVADRIGFGNTFSFSGYQIEDEYGDSGSSVDLQVLSIWSVFLNHNIKYSNITTTSTANNMMLTQYVRTLGESFGNSQANCLDGSVLFASVLRKLGIDPFLVIVPGHMFVGYIRDYDPFSIGFLETTMMGNVDISRHTRDDSILGRIKNWTGIGRTQSSVTVDSFRDAQTAGEERFYIATVEKLFDGISDENEQQEVWDKFWDEVQSFDDIFELWNEEYDLYAIIDISFWRSAGIMPVTRY